MIVGAFVIVMSSVYAQKVEIKNERKDEGEFNIGEDELYNLKKEAFANPKKDNPNLPNILLVGDSISIGYTPYVRINLKEKVDVYRVPSNARNSSFGLQNLDKSL